MHYWFITARLFEQVNVTEEDKYTNSSPMEESAGQIISHALANLQTLIRLYYSCHGSDTYNIFLVTMCSYIGFGALHAISQLDTTAYAVREGYEATALLCAGILHDQRTNAHIFDVVFRLIQQSLPPAVAAELVRFFHISDVDQSKMAVISRHVQSSWPVSVALMPGETDNRRLDNLLRAIRELSVDDSDDASTP
jgi:N-methylhydantoinase A/oxoprolinase/acetone carboxylase beta subunit